nr:mRNA surveillance protein Pelota [Desulfurococcales archaeon]
MHVRVLDRRRRRIEVRPESEEDLWVLRNTLRPGDLVTGRTLRDVAVKGSDSKQRRPIVVTLRLKTAEFQPFTGKLRLYGVIVEGPEEYGLRGRHHAMTVSPGQAVVVERESGWPERALERLRSSGPRGRAVVAAVDYDEYAVALVALQGYRVVAEGSSRLPGKDDPTRDEELERYASRLARLIVETASREGARVVVVAGPGPLKEDVARRVREAAPNLKVYVDSTSMGGSAGVSEALRRPTIARALREYSLVEAEAWLEDAMRVAAREPDRVVFGARAARAAAAMGAVERIIASDEVLYTIDDEEREAAQEALEEAEARRAEVLIVPADSPVGERLRPLGGVVAVLRYPVP